MKRRAISRGVAFSFVSQAVLLSAVEKVGGIALTLALVRILSPEDFGVFAIASAVILILMTISAQRFAEFSFHVPDGEPPRFDEHFGFGIVLHAAISVLILFAAYFASRIEAYASAAPLLVIGSIAPLLNAPRIIYSVSLTRDLDWRRIRLLSLLSFAVASLTTLGLALKGFGPYALIASILVKPMVFNIDMALKRRDLLAIAMPTRKHVKSLRFGGFRSGAASAAQGRTLAENLTVGGMLGVATLGYYGRAFGLAQLTVGWLGTHLTSIVYPLLTKFTPGTGDYRRAAGLFIRLGLWGSIPPALILGLADEAAVTVLYGEKWLDALPFVRPMIVVVLALTFASALNVIALSALGAHFVFANQVAALCAGLMALVVALPVSLVAYAWSLALLLSVLVIAITFSLLRAGALGGVDLARAVAPCAILSMLAAGSFSTEIYAGVVGDFPHWAELLFVAAASGAGMVVLARVIDRGGVADVLRFVPDGLRIPIVRVLLLPETSIRPQII